MHSNEKFIKNLDELANINFSPQIESIQNRIKYQISEKQQTKIFLVYPTLVLSMQTFQHEIKLMFNMDFNYTNRLYPKFMNKNELEMVICSLKELETVSDLEQVNQDLIRQEIKQLQNLMIEANNETPNDNKIFKSSLSMVMERSDEDYPGSDYSHVGSVYQECSRQSSSRKNSQNSPNIVHQELQQNLVSQDAIFEQQLSPSAILVEVNQEEMINIPDSEHILMESNNLNGFDSFALDHIPVILDDHSTELRNQDDNNEQQDQYLENFSIHSTGGQLEVNRGVPSSAHVTYSNDNEEHRELNHIQMVNNSDNIHIASNQEDNVLNLNDIQNETINNSNNNNNNIQNRRNDRKIIQCNPLDCDNLSCCSTNCLIN